MDGILQDLRGSGADSRVPFAADRRHLVKFVENMRLMQSEVGNYRQLKLLRHCRRIATLVEWPTPQDFAENGEATAAGIQDEADVVRCRVGPRST